MVRGAMMARRFSLRRFARDRRGAAAVEFAFVAGPFIFLLMALIELGLLFVVDALFHDATSQAGRLIRTGQAQGAMSVEQFRTEICSRMSVFSAECEDKLIVDVRVIDQFMGESGPQLGTDEDGAIDQSDLRFVMGGPRSIILVTAWLPRNVFSPLLAKGHEQVGRQRVLTAATTFRNEPFGS